jgi:release factor glutamine methyltransferase
LWGARILGLPFRVTPDVLIPRPETELMIDMVREFFPEDGRERFADLGTAPVFWP